MADKRGRGRLHSIDKLPAEADGAVQWAAAELLARDRTQSEILDAFNSQLVDVGCEPISASAFNRYSMRQTALARQLTETREVAKAVMEVIGPDAADEMTVMIVQLMKQAAIEHFQKGRMATKEMKDIGHALSAIMAAQRASAENAAKKKAEQDAIMEKAARSAAEAIAQTSPDSDASQILSTIRDAYGIAEGG